MYLTIEMNSLKWSFDLMLLLKVKVEVDLCFVFDMIHESDKSVNLLSS